MSNLLDDILAESTPGRAIPPSPTSIGSGSPALFQRDLQYRGSRSSGFGFGAAEQQQSPQQQSQVQYSEEMDWSPTRSKHRAFNDFGPPKAPNQVFGQPSPGPNSSPFWYKVPPAPITPAQKLRGAPRPLIAKPVEKKSIFATSSMSAAKPSSNDDEKPGSLDVAFANPTFFAPSTSNPSDPRSSLADLLNTSFTLRNDDADDDDDDADTIDGDTYNETPGGAGRPTSSAAAAPRTAGLRNSRLLDVFTLAILLAAWLHATAAAYPYSRDVMLGAMLLSAATAVHLTGDAVRQMRAGPSPPGLASVLHASLGVGELAVSGRFALLVWDGRMAPATAGLQGASVIGAMLVHEMWNAAC